MNDILRGYDCSIWGEGKGLLMQHRPYVTVETGWFGKASTQLAAIFQTTPALEKEYD